MLAAAFEEVEKGPRPATSHVPPARGYRRGKEVGGRELGEQSPGVTDRCPSRSQLSQGRNQSVVRFSAARVVRSERSRKFVPRSMRVH